MNGLREVQRPHAVDDTRKRRSARILPCLMAALSAGALAILVNTLLLHLGSWIGIKTGEGGLLKWLELKLSPLSEAVGLSDVLHSLSLPTLPAPAAALLFHVFVGLIMALVYAFAVEPVLRRYSPLVQALLYASAVWLVNALVVLPGLGQGFAGHHQLDGLGIVWFAATHTVFFVLLALIYRRLHSAANHLEGHGYE